MSVMTQEHGPAAGLDQGAVDGAWPARIDALSDAELSAVTTAAVKAWAARCELRTLAAPMIDPDATTATEVVVVVSELIRAAGLNLFDVAMWYRRPEAIGAVSSDARTGGARG
jgi:hypothetical protein